VSSGSVPSSAISEKVSSSTSMPNMETLSMSGGGLPTPLIPVPMIMERRTFAIDQARDDEEEDEMYAIGGDDDVMDEVDAFLEAHDSGLTDAQKAEAQGLLTASPLK